MSLNLSLELERGHKVLKIQPCQLAGTYATPY